MVTIPTCATPEEASAAAAALGRVLSLVIDRAPGGGLRATALIVPRETATRRR